MVASPYVRDVRSTHFDAYRTMLDHMPKSFGKSPRDWAKTSTQIEADGRKLAPDKRGREAGSVNRHMGDIGSLATVAFQKGFN